MTEQTPTYYTRDGIECADAMRPFVDRLSGNQAFYVGSILKYLWRFGEKTGADPVSDLRKVIQYTQMTIEEIEADRIDKK